MNEKNREAGAFIEIWTGQFRRAIETVCGQRAGIRSRSLGEADLPAAEDLQGYLWWKQTFHRDTQRDEAFLAWFGAAEPTWTAIGDQIASDQHTAEQAYFEILGRGNEGAAGMLSKHVGRKVEYSPGGPEQLPSVDGLMVWEVSVSLEGAELPPLLVATAGELERAPEQPASQVARPALALRMERPPTPMFGTLMNLELPMAVALGCSTLPIRDILKITAGSLIELDRNVGQWVDLLVHGTVVARAELVSLQGNYGIRIKEVISPEDRMAIRGAA